jgi:hypothetical protein
MAQHWRKPDTGQQFLDAVYAHPGPLDATMDFIFTTVDDWFWAGKFADVDEALRLADLDRLGVDLMLSLLTITLGARSKLKERTQFFERSYDWAAGKGAGNLELLFYGLEPR